MADLPSQGPVTPPTMQGVDEGLEPLPARARRRKPGDEADPAGEAVGPDGREPLPAAADGAPAAAAAGVEVAPAADTPAALPPLSQGGAGMPTVSAGAGAATSGGSGFGSGLLWIGAAGAIGLAASGGGGASGGNRKPVTGGDALASGSEDDASITGTVPAATDAENDVMTYELVDPAPPGLTFNRDGSFSYVPQAIDNALGAGETRTVTIAYVANDGKADSEPAQLIITISGANDVPVSGGDRRVTGNEDMALVSGVVPAARDVDGDAVSYELTAAPPAGLTFHADGSFTVTPLAADQALGVGESREVVFQYVVSDGVATSAPATITVVIQGANDAPVGGGPAAAAGSEDDEFIAGAVPAASDVDGDALTYVLTSSTPPGLAFESTGVFRYYPQQADQALAAGESRVVEFQYAATDGNLLSDAATVTITVTGANDAPVSGGVGAFVGSEDDALISGTVPRAVDAEGDPVVYALAGDAPPGLVFRNDGTFDLAPQAIDQSLDDGEMRVVSFLYVAGDGIDASAPTAVTVTINGANDVPVAPAQDLRVINDGQVAAGIFLGASDVDSHDVLTYQVVVAPAHGTLEITAAGEIRYLPDAAYAGPDSFSYRANDGTADSAVATVSIEVVSPQVSTPGDDILYGDSGQNTIDALAGNDVVHGLAGNDYLLGGPGNDRLDGGSGDDVLEGGAGDDVYLFGAGAGSDVINNNDVDGGSGAGAGLDAVELDPALAFADIFLRRNGDDLHIGIHGTVDRLVVTGYFSLDPLLQVEEIRFTDGSGRVLLLPEVELLVQVIAPTEGDDEIYGTSDADVIDGLGGNDRLFGRGGDDTLAGGPGDDFLQGDTGNDTYLFGRDGGSDTIRNADVDAGMGAGSGLDVIVLAADLTPADVVFQRVGDDLAIVIRGSADRLLVEGYFSADPASVVDEIRFSDGSGTSLDPAAVQALALVPSDGPDVIGGSDGDDVLYGGGGDDTIQGNDGNDVIDGGSGANVVFGGEGDDTLVNGDDGGILVGEAGDDVLHGGAGSEIMSGSGGNDVYLFGRGGGHDVILNSDTDLVAGVAGAGTDAIRLDPDIGLADLAFSRLGDDLVISIIGSSDQLAVYNYFAAEAGWQIDEIRLTDGSGLVLAPVDVASLVLVATEGDDVLGGTSADDVIDGLGGNDRIEGHAGNDRLVGGTGDDQLEGGTGNDTYVFRRGDGRDSVLNTDVDGTGLDGVELDATISEADLVVRRDGDDLLLAIAGSDDRVTVVGHFSGEPGAQLDEVRFTDGSATVLSAADLEALARVATEGDDYLVGTAGDDAIDGLGGNDQIHGGAGNDVLAGGAGDDQLFGGTGADTYVYRYAAGGTDTLADYFNAADDDPVDLDVLAIHEAPGAPLVATIVFELVNEVEANPDLFIQIGDDPASGVLIRDFFSHDGVGGVLPGPGDIEEVIVYADAGFTELARYTSQQIADIVNGPVE